MTLGSDGSIKGDGWGIYANGTTNGLKIEQGASVSIKMAGGFIGSKSGYLGSSSEGGAPMSWDGSGVTFRQGVKIGGAEINENGALSYGQSLFGSKQIVTSEFVSNGGGITLKPDGGQGKATISYNIANTLVNNGKSGTAYFSDGGSLTFTNGILTGCTPNINGGLNSWVSA